jgi:Family of unknown function (DUF5677)
MAPSDAISEPEHPLSHAPLLKAVKTVHDIAVARAFYLRTPRGYTEHYTLLLYFTLIECTGSVLLLRENERVAGVAAIVRSALDAFIDIKNLQKEPEYWRSLEAADSMEWKKLMQTASAKGNEFLAGLSADPNFASYRSTINQNLDDAAARGVKKVEVEDRFNNVGQYALYKSLWPMLSADAHNNTSLLHSRHARTVGEAFVLELYSGGGAFGSAPLMTLAEMLMYSSEDIHETYGFGKGMASEIRAIVDPLRAAAEAAEKRGEFPRD